jgi:AcrR family transcriptional regulator
MAGGERRLQILRVAMRLFSQRGFRGTTTKEIAAAAGVSEAMVFRHFATKEELYSAILDHKACHHETMDPLRIVAEAVTRKDDRAVFEGLALDALNQHDCDPEFHRLLLYSALEEHELAQMFWEKFVKRVYRTLRTYIRERQRGPSRIFFCTELPPANQDRMGGEMAATVVRQMRIQRERDWANDCSSVGQSHTSNSVVAGDGFRFPRLQPLQWSAEQRCRERQSGSGDYSDQHRGGGHAAVAAVF